MRPGDVSDVTHRNRGLRFEKSQLVELPGKKTGDFLSSPRLQKSTVVKPVVCGGDSTLWGWGDGKVSIERLCISLLMSKNLLTQR